MYLGGGGTPTIHGSRYTWGSDLRLTPTPAAVDAKRVCTQGYPPTQSPRDLSRDTAAPNSTCTMLYLMAAPGVMPRGSSSVGHVAGRLKMGIGALAPGYLFESKARNSPSHA